MAVYIGGSINSEPLDQTDLNKWYRCNLGGGGESTFEGEADQGGPLTRRPIGGTGRPPYQRLVVFFGVVSSGTF
jgi:hypothetical protein